MEFVYAIVENGVAYPKAYTTYAAAVKAANDKHKEELEEQIRENPEYKDEVFSDMNPTENASGATQLYIEKGIIILIHKLPVVGMAGGRRQRSRSKGATRK